MRTRFAEHRLIYAIAAIVVAILVIWGLIAFDRAEANAEAEAKADQLIAAFELAGLPAPEQDQITGTLGTDGGALCELTDEELAQGQLNQNLANGAAHVGLRPVIVDELVIQGEALIIGIYCPEKLPAFQEYVEDLEFDDVVRE